MGSSLGGIIGQILDCEVEKWGEEKVKGGEMEILTEHDSFQKRGHGQEEAVARGTQGMREGSWPYVSSQKSQIHKYCTRACKEKVTSLFSCN